MVDAVRGSKTQERNRMGKVEVEGGKSVYQ